MSLKNKVLNVTSQGRHGPEFGNVHEIERVMSLISGAAMTLVGLSRLSVKGLAMAAGGGALFWRGFTGHSRAYQLLGINTARPSNVTRAGSNQVSAMPHHQGVSVEHSIAIDRSVDEVYMFWRNLPNLPLFMKHLKSVTMTGLGRSHWVAKAPLGGEVAWDAEIVNDKPNQLIAWRSLEGSDIANTGSVHFYPSSNPSGCVVKVALKYNPPGGKVGSWIARILGEEPKRQMAQDLLSLKRMLESGDVPLLQGQPVMPELM